jgi:hypothetical protein
MGGLNVLNLGMGFKKWIVCGRKDAVHKYCGTLEQLVKSNDLNAYQIHYADDRDVYQPQP